MDLMTEDRSKSSADVVAKCNSKCEQMQQQNRLCHCWTLTTTHCDFYHMPLDLFLAQIADLGDKVTMVFSKQLTGWQMGFLAARLATRLVNTVPVDSADEPCWNHSAAVNVYPTLVQNTNGRTSYFPLMKRFVHTTNRPDAGTWLPKDLMLYWFVMFLYLVVFCLGVGLRVGSDVLELGIFVSFESGHNFLTFFFLEPFNCILVPAPFWNEVLGDESFVKTKMPGERSNSFPCHPGWSLEFRKGGDTRGFFLLLYKARFFTREKHPGRQYDLLCQCIWLHPGLPAGVLLECMSLCHLCLMKFMIWWFATFMFT